jgi:CMP-N,N'-diacetyllegionaminic acid synthase
VKVFCIIPTRGGSEEIKGKNLRLMNHRPLLQYVLSSAKESNSLERIYVSTDCDTIAEFSNGQGVSVVRHDPYLSDTKMPSFGVVYSLATILRDAGEVPDAFLILRATSPLLQSAHIQDAIKLLRSRRDSDSVVSVVDVPMHPKKFLSIDSDGFLIPYDSQSPESISHVPVRRQEFDPVYMRTAALYLSKSQVILNGKMWGDCCMPLIIPKRFSININTEDDWYIAESVLSRMHSTSSGDHFV